MEEAYEETINQQYKTAPVDLYLWTKEQQKLLDMKRVDFKCKKMKCPTPILPKMPLITGKYKIVNRYDEFGYLKE